MNSVLGTTILDILPCGAANSRGLQQFWETGLDRLIFWIVILAVLMTLGYFLVTKLRPKPIQKELEATRWLSKYDELHSKGELSDEEFRTIKTTLTTQLQDELKDNGENG